MSPLTTDRTRIVLAMVAAIATAAAPSARAQVAPAPPPTATPPATYPPGTTYPQAATYPQGTTYPQDSMAQQAPGSPRPSPLRELFAGTIAAVLQAVSGGVVTGLSGAIVHWFDRKAGKGPYAQQPGYGTQQGVPGYPGTSGAYSYPQTTPTYGAQPQYPTTSYPTTSYPPSYPTTSYPTTSYPSSSYPTTASSTGGPYQTNPYPTGPSASDPYGTTSTYPSTSQPYPATQSASDPYAHGAAGSQNPYATQAPGYDWSSTQVYDPRTGQVSSAQAGGYSLAVQGAGATNIVAGGAYDVSAIGPGGSEAYVNAATHEFRTGDRFKVYFRPTLPGRLDIYNINPHGRETRIDSVDMAAGQLTTLGPYEFAATKGDEALRFVLSPCATGQLIAATRDIVNVGGYAGTGYVGAPPGSGGLTLSTCGTTTRSADQVTTRDIRKVGVDGTTSFALDPVSRSELASGQLATREFTVYFHHR